MLLVDLLGWGFSDRPDEFGYTVRDHAETIVALIRSFDVRNVDIFGHSIGGLIAEFRTLYGSSWSCIFDRGRMA